MTPGFRPLARGLVLLLVAGCARQGAPTGGQPDRVPPVVVSVEPEPRFRVTGREELFEGNYVQYRWSRQYDIHPDGDRFVLVKNPARGNVEIGTNWFDELRSTGR